MQNFHPNLIRLLVFDLDSLTANFDQESWDNFRQFLLILDDRDFETLLISGSIEASEWESFAKLSVLHSTAENAFQNNPVLSAKDVFWFSEQPELQKKISRTSQTSLEAMAALLKTAACNISIYTTCCKYFIPAESLQQICLLTFSN